MKYTFIESDGNNHILKAVFEDESYDLLNGFLLAEVRNFGDEVEQGLSSLLEGSRECYCFNGNIYSLSSDSRTSTLTDEIAFADNSLTVSTRELYELVSAYRTKSSSLRQQASGTEPKGGEPDG